MPFSVQSSLSSKDSSENITTNPVIFPWISETLAEVNEFNNLFFLIYG